MLNREELLADMAKAVGSTVEEVQEVIDSAPLECRSESRLCNRCFAVCANEVCSNCITLAVAGELTDKEAETFPIPHLVGLAWVAPTLAHLIPEAAAIKAARG